jgi:hypothetical protein
MQDTALRPNSQVAGPLQHHKSPSRLGQRLATLGIDAQTGRRAALLQLAITVPAAVLSDLLGIATTTAADWAHAAGGDWSRYAAEIARARSDPPPTPAGTTR